MPRANLLFMIVAPLAVMVVIAILVIGIGETLLAVHEYANHSLHVGGYAAEEQNHQAEEIARLYPVGVALAIGSVFLIGGSIASRLAGSPARRDVTRH